MRDDLMSAANIEAAAIAIGEKLASGLSGISCGSVEVRRAQAIFHEGPDDESALFLILTLSDPHGDTWPVNDLLALRRKVRHDARQLRLPVPIYLELEPETDAAQADDEPANEQQHLHGI